MDRIQRPYPSAKWPESGFNYQTLKSCGQDVRIADAVIIKHPELVNIGNHVAIDDYTVITTALELGDYVHIGPHCSIIGGAEAKLTMHDFSGLSAGCRVICASDDYHGSGLTNPTIPKEFRCNVKMGEVVIWQHVVIGTNTVIYPGVEIAEGTAVGACSLVNRVLKSWGIYFGIPARFATRRPSDRILEFERQLREQEKHAK